jgi:hypothetical protein
MLVATETIDGVSTAFFGEIELSDAGQNIMFLDRIEVGGAVLPLVFTATLAQVHGQGIMDTFYRENPEEMQGCTMMAIRAPEGYGQPLEGEVVEEPSRLILPN